MGFLDFPEAAELSGFSLIFMFLVYGYILLNASKLISDGSELLMLILNPGVVGGLVLPILGAVPDGAIVLFSGLGPVAEVQEQISVGVGTLAGSTIMLLTLPFAAAILLGRVDILPNGRGNYRKPKLTRGLDPMNTGVTVDDDMPINAKIMLASAVTYIIVQAPAFAKNTSLTFAVVAFCVSIVGLCAYCIYQVMNVGFQERKIQMARERAMKAHIIDNLFFSSVETPLLADGSINDNFIRDAFLQFDKNGDGMISSSELSSVLFTIDPNMQEEEMRRLLAEIDTDRSQTISLGEFRIAMQRWMKDRQIDRKTGKHLEPVHVEPEEEEEEEEEHNLTPSQVKFKSISMLAIGAIMVTIFSDPMVDIISSMGDRIGVSAFYVSFLLTPLASNSSEVIAALILSAKKTQKTITLTVSSLFGAATMNNTFCLSIFLALVYFRQLKWSFSAEVVSILAVELCMCIIGLRTTIKTFNAYIILSLYPLSLLLVWGLETFLGWD